MPRICCSSARTRAPAGPSNLKLTMAYDRGGPTRRNNPVSPSYGIIARFESIKRIAFVLFLVTSIGAIAQQPGQSGPLTNQRIIELVHSGVRVDELARMIATAPEVNFDLTPTGENAMMQAGVSEETIKAMAAREGSIMDNNAPVQQPTMQPQPSSSRWTHSSEWSPRFSLFGGYSYLNVDTKGLASRQSANGFRRISSASEGTSEQFRYPAGYNDRSKI